MRTEEEKTVADLEDNMDVRRLPGLTEKDQARLKKYLAAYNRLLAALKGEHQSTQ